MLIHTKLPPYPPDHPLPEARGKLPLTVQSMDNCSHNGDKVRTGVMAYADRWVKDTQEKYAEMLEKHGVKPTASCMEVARACPRLTPHAADGDGIGH